jgi:signal transduction histidine kinase/CheY-like chemotaxis protein
LWKSPLPTPSMNKVEVFTSVLFRVLDRTMPDWVHKESEEVLRTSRITYIGLLLLLGTLFSFGIIGVLQGDKIFPWIVLITGSLGLPIPYIHRRFKSIKIPALYSTIVTTLMLIISGAFSGGLISTSTLWFGAVGIFVMVTLGTRIALIWIGAICFQALVLWWLTTHGYTIPDYENPIYKPILWAISCPAGLLLTFGVLQSFFESHQRALKSLDIQTKTLIAQAKELGYSREKAEAASRSRSDFIATVSHEIRTPMNGILGVTQLMQGTSLSEEQKKYLEALRFSAEGLLSILGDILDFSKIEAGKLEVRPETFELRILCEECFATFAGNAETKQLRLNLILDSDLPQYLLGDPVRIRQILLNLIGNSIKFTQQGEVSLHVKGVTGQNGKVQFTVQDTGIGMSESTLKILFEPYTQADATSSRKYGGTGLGLAICHRLTEMMEGTIEVKSQLGLGTQFTIELPLPQGTLSKQGIAFEKQEKPKHDFQGKQVLLAEDNAINRMVAIKLLEKIGIKVQIATNGSEAVGLWRTMNFDLIFMDCQMPEIDGYQATRIIRDSEKKSGNQKRIPILALTAHAMEEDRQRCLDAGMDDYLTKPVKLESLSMALEKWAKQFP